MIENYHFARLHSVPEEHIYTQIAVNSERYGYTRFSMGSEIEYDRINWNYAPKEWHNRLRRSIAELIYVELEEPSFTPQSPQMPYDISAFEQLIELPGNMTLLAWRQNEQTRSPELVGYLIGAPYKNYPTSGQGDFQRDATLDGTRSVPVPDYTTWMFDTFAVRDTQRGKKIGDNLIELMLQHVIYPGSPYDKLVTFAVNHPTSFTKDMVLKHRWLKDHLIVQALGPYRGITGYYMMFDINQS